MNKNRTVLLFSGGIDSTVCMTVKRDALLLFVDYGQPSLEHERAAAIAVARVHGDTILVTSASLSAPYSASSNTIPGRNAALIALAHNVALCNGFGSVTIGVNRDDSKAYEDCTERFIDAMAMALRFHILAPLQRDTKAEVIAMGRRMGAPIGLTWSCYYPATSGPCNVCGACMLRASALR